MEAVNILGGVDRFEHAFGVDVGRERQLHEDAVDSSRWLRSAMISSRAPVELVLGGSSCQLPRPSFSQAAILLLT